MEAIRTQGAEGSSFVLACTSLCEVAMWEMRVGTVFVEDSSLEKQGNRVRAAWWVCMVVGLLCAVVVVSCPVVRTKACCHDEHIYTRTPERHAQTFPLQPSLPRFPQSCDCPCYCTSPSLFREGNGRACHPCCCRTVDCCLAPEGHAWTVVKARPDLASGLVTYRWLTLCSKKGDQAPCSNDE